MDISNDTIILNNKEQIIELENDIKKITNLEYNFKNSKVDYSIESKEKIIEDQNNYICYLYSVLDGLYNGKKRERKLKIDEIVKSGKINEKFYRLYNMGRFIYNNKYYPINNMYIKVFKDNSNDYFVYQLLSIKEKDFMLLTDNMVDINNLEYISFYKFRDSSIFKLIYTNDNLCQNFDININTDEKLNLFLKYLKDFNQEGYDFFSELQGDKYE